MSTLVSRDSSVGESAQAWYAGITPYQWLVLFVAWLGWVFDAMDATIYAIVLHPALQELLTTSSPSSVSQELIGWYGGIIFSIFLIGWAIGGIAFGILADRFGRTRVLMATIFLYAVFTGAAAVSQDWWHLAAYRFLTALGIGGEWAAGAALVAETWPEKQRAKAAGILQSAWAAGFFLAATANLLLQESYGWRALFLVGVLPAFVAVLVRCWVKEPERWTHAPHEGNQLSSIFKGDLRKATFIGSTLAFVAVFGLWGSTNWAPTLVRELPDLRTQGEAAISRSVSYAIMALNAGALFGYLGFGPLADRFGRRPVFAFMCVGSAIMLPVTYLAPSTYAGVLMLLPILGFFNNGIFSGFPIYLPELYPTRLRATGSGFCFNAGRILASASPFLTGWLVTALGTFGRAASTVALIYLVGLAALAFAPETKGASLPD
ncbi:MAG TPA: MFS transporter [Nitrospira sp.]|nr:MFS transporter [Nitrospira sp.]